MAVAMWEKERTYHAREDAPGSQAGDGSPKYEGDRIWSGAADGGADLEQQDGSQKRGLDGEEFVQLSKHQSEGAAGEQVRRAVLANIGLRVERVGDFGKWPSR